MDRGTPLPARVFLVDGRELLRRGVAALLAVQEDLEVVGEAARADDVLPRVRATRPDVLLLGELLSEGADVDAAARLCRELRGEPDPPACLLLTDTYDVHTSASHSQTTAAEHAGAAGCVPEDVHGGELVAALRRLAAGDPLREHADAFPQLPPEPPDPLARLTATDREIVALIGAGMTNRQIGKQLGLSERTIKNHVSRILAALAMERRTQIAALASSLRLTPGVASGLSTNLGT